jgi:hypothetical protein
MNSCFVFICEKIVDKQSNKVIDISLLALRSHTPPVVHFSKNNLKIFLPELFAYLELPVDPHID